MIASADWWIGWSLLAAGVGVALLSMAHPDAMRSRGRRRGRR